MGLLMEWGAKPGSAGWRHWPLRNSQICAYDFRWAKICVMKTFSYFSFSVFLNSFALPLSHSLSLSLSAFHSPSTPGRFFLLFQRCTFILPSITTVFLFFVFRTNNVRLIIECTSASCVCAVMVNWCCVLRQWMKPEKKKRENKEKKNEQEDDETKQRWFWRQRCDPTRWHRATQNNINNKKDGPDRDAAEQWERANARNAIVRTFAKILSHMPLLYALHTIYIWRARFSPFLSPCREYFVECRPEYVWLWLWIGPVQNNWKISGVYY